MFHRINFFSVLKVVNSFEKNCWRTDKDVTEVLFKFYIHIYPQIIFYIHQYFADKVDKGDISSSQFTTRNHFMINNKKNRNPFIKF